MNAIVIEREDVDVLPPELAALVPEDAPKWVGPGWIAELLDVKQQTVRAAIKAGKLPVLAVPGGKGTTAALVVRPHDAVRLWGPRVVARRARAAAEANKSL